MHIDVAFPEKDIGICVVYLTGFPTFPKENSFTKMCQKNGITVFVPHYYGSFLSDGEFLPENVIKTASDTIKFVKLGYSIDLFSMKEKTWKNNKIILGGGSFGGLIVLSASTKNTPDKILLSAPLIYMKNSNDLLHTLGFARKVYKNVYRGIESERWGMFFVAQNKMDENIIKSKDILIVHGNNDDTINITYSRNFSKKFSNVKLLELKEVGHNVWEQITQDDLKKIIDWIKS